MTWLKLTRTALYLMKGSLYTDRVDVLPHSTPGEQRLKVPLSWFRTDDAPKRMAVELSASATEPQPSPFIPLSRWLKLTRKALYLMEGGRYVEKVDLQPHSSPGETKLALPPHWFNTQNAPGRMAIELAPNTPEPSPGFRFPDRDWALLTKTALYLMEGGDSFKYLDKVDLIIHNTQTNEFRLTIPRGWFTHANTPRRLMVQTNESWPEPQPRAPRILEVFDRVLTTSDWEARKIDRTHRRTTPQYIVIHHTADRNPPRDPSKRTVSGAKRLARTIQNAHMDQFGFSDSGHNFLNSTAGVLLEGRHGSLNAILQGRCVRSAHAGRSNINASPGIENEGCFGTGQNTGCPGEQNARTLQMSQAQWDSLVELCAGICKSCDIDPDNIKGHRDFSATECPGQLLYNQLGRLRAEVRDRLVKGF